MPRTKTEFTPAEYGILGLLREKPAYGYELQRHFSGKQGLGRVCPVEPGMVYASLKSLSGLELIDGRWDNSSYPPKAVYTTTDLGEMTFQRWLLAPVGRIREVRHDFMVKLYFALREDKELAARLIEAQLAATRDYAGEIAEEQKAFQDPGSFDAIVLGSKASAARITIEWLEKAQDNLAAEFASPQGS